MVLTRRTSLLKAEVGTFDTITRKQPFNIRNMSIQQVLTRIFLMSLAGSLPLNLDPLQPVVQQCHCLTLQVAKVHRQVLRQQRILGGLANPLGVG